jgi:excisionase family DNA binding protein
MNNERVVTVLNPAYWTKNVAQLAKVLRSPSIAPARIADPSGKVTDPVAVHDPEYWGHHPTELDSALRRATGTSAAAPAPDTGVGAAPPGVERLTLTVEEAATMLGISRAFAYEAVNRGEIPCIRIGRRVLVPRSALDRMLSGTERPDAGAS